MTLKGDSRPKVVVTSRSFAKSAVLREELLSVFPNSIFTDHRQKLLGEKITQCQTLEALDLLTPMRL